MSILYSVMLEEYDRIKRIIYKIDEELNEIPKGYISKKKINEKIYHYLQYRENGKIKSKYIKGNDVELYINLIEHRNDLLLKKKGLEADIKKLEKVLGLEK